MKTENEKMPWYIWSVIVGLSLIQPALHLWIRFFPPAGTVATGLHIPDSALFLYSMRMFENGLDSLYATCLTGHDGQGLVYYCVPHLWLYGALGVISGSLHIDPFLVYGLANGLGAFLYLWVVYRLLCVVARSYARTAFLLFALSAGPGGLLYIVTGALGLHQHPSFELYFSRFGYYDLMEGPHCNPVLYFPRFYYTLSLALCLGGLTAIIRAAQTPDLNRNQVRSLMYWTIPVALGSFINARFTVFTLGLVVLFLGLGMDAPWTRRLKLAAFYVLPAAIGFAVAHALMRTNPVVIENHLQVASMAMWFSPFVMVAWLHLLLGSAPIVRLSASLPTGIRAVAGGLAGYLIAYAVAYVLYQGYYGNLWVGRDGSVAASISDIALLGAIPGAVLGGRFIRATQPRMPEAWIMMWFLLYFAVSISGWGAGWFLRFGPQRLEVFLWLPLCLMAAMGLRTLPRGVARPAWAVLLVCGCTSIGVAVFAFQGPGGRANAAGTYATQHTEIMSQNDALAMKSLGRGIVLAPAPASDIIVYQRGNPVVFGIGSFNLTDVPYLLLRTETLRFFQPGTPESDRHDILKRWCVKYVYCPDTWPVDPATLRELEADLSLKEVVRAGNARVFSFTDPLQIEL